MNKTKNFKTINNKQTVLRFLTLLKVATVITLSGYCIVSMSNYLVTTHVYYYIGTVQAIESIFLSDQLRMKRIIYLPNTLIQRPFEPWESFGRRLHDLRLHLAVYIIIYSVSINRGLRSVLT